MPYPIESADCPLCSSSATRQELRRGDGFRYDCPACGGRFEIGPSALNRAEKGQVHPDLPAAVRQFIARGEVPRVAIVGGQWQPLEVVGRQPNDPERDKH